MQARRCDDAVGVFIHIDGDDGAIADAVIEVALLTKRQEKILTEAPVEEGADALVDADHFKVGKLACLRQGCLGGRNQPVLRVIIDEDFDLVADLHVGRDIAGGQEDGIMLAAIEVEPVVRGFNDAKRVIFADVCHVVTKCRKRVWCDVLEHRGDVHL